MADIIPFRGMLYNPAKVGDLSKVMAPPYDVISPKKQDELYSRHPNNIIRLILRKKTEAGALPDEAYNEAALDLDAWVKDGIFQRDERPAIYYYAQTYALTDGATQCRKGFIALSRLEEFGKGRIHPHEKTLSGPKADRLKLMQKCNANLSAIFSLYSDHSLETNKILNGHVSGKPPVIDVVDDDGIHNTLWRIDDAAVIERVQSLMKDKPLFIADGHHRYETALNYRELRLKTEKNPTGNEPYNYVMMYFSNMDDEGMTIWPTHRIIHGIDGFDADKFLKECNEYFDMEAVEYDNGNEKRQRAYFVKKIESSGKSRTTFGLKMQGRSAFYVLTLKSRDVMDRVFGANIPEVFKGLDVTVLHSLVLSNILGITSEAQESQKNIIYVKKADEAISAMADQKNQLAFILNPTKIEQVEAVAEAGLVMPQKSTYFYPKLLSGLVQNIHALSFPYSVST